MEERSEMKARTLFLAVAAIGGAVLVMPRPAEATGSMAECTAAGFPKSCCLEQQNKGAWGEAARTRKWNELAVCKTRAANRKPTR
jgi:hypothetical protein